MRGWNYHNFRQKIIKIVVKTKGIFFYHYEWLRWNYQLLYKLYFLVHSFINCFWFCFYKFCRPIFFFGINLAISLVAYYVAKKKKIGRVWLNTVLIKPHIGLASIRLVTRRTNWNWSNLLDDYWRIINYLLYYCLLPLIFALILWLYFHFIYLNFNWILISLSFLFQLSTHGAVVIGTSFLLFDAFTFILYMHIKFIYLNY